MDANNENENLKDINQEEREGLEKVKGSSDDDFNANDWDDNVETDKYLAMEQPGVTFTPDTDPTLLNSDHAGSADQSSDMWQSTGGNSRNSDAFNQDDYILRDNIDLDEDQNTSISSEDNDK